MDKIALISSVTNCKRVLVLIILCTILLWIFTLARLLQTDLVQRYFVGDDQQVFHHHDHNQESNKNGQFRPPTKANFWRRPFFDPEQEYAKLTCKFARPDPFDPQIMPQIYHPRGIHCEQRQPNLTYVHYNGSVVLNQTEVNKSIYRDFIDQINCTLEFFDRDPVKENDRIEIVTFQTRLQLYQPVPMFSDMVKVQCMDWNNSEIYYNIHAHPSWKNKTFDKPNGDKLSVLMLMLDSTSTSVLKRHLTKTYDYVKNVMQFKMFNGFSKVGDNSFPNMIAALTGYRYQYEQKNMPPDIDEDMTKNHFDHWPLVWKLYAQKGYATVFNEDKAEWGLFHYMTKGFKYKPVDFYYNTYWYSVFLREYYKKETDLYCFRNMPKVERLLDIAKRHVITMNQVLQFHYVFLTDLCHEYQGSEEERADEYVYDFLKTLYEGGYFENTVVLFFSDHGHRYTPIRSTLTGLLEERTPMFNIWFPSWFYKRYPSIEQNLELNTMRLSSLFDVHETLIDLVNQNFNGAQRPEHSRGYSQLYEIPVDRQCFEAGIPDHHCTCISMTPMLVNSSEVQLVAQALLDHINNVVLQPYQELCSNFTLGRVLRAEKLFVNEKLAQGVKNYDKDKDPTFNITTDPQMEENNIQKPGSLKATDEIRVAIELEPMQAQFEAVVEFDTTNQTYVVSSDVSRLNAYGNQASCAPKKALMKYCVCYDFLANIRW